MFLWVVVEGQDSWDCYKRSDSIYSKLSVGSKRWELDRLTGYVLILPWCLIKGGRCPFWYRPSCFWSKSLVSSSSNYLILFPLYFFSTTFCKQIVFFLFINALLYLCLWSSFWSGFITLTLNNLGRWSTGDRSFRWVFLWFDMFDFLSPGHYPSRTWILD